MLSAIVLLPLAAAVLLAVGRRLPDAAVRVAWLAIALVELALTVVATALAPPLRPGRLALVERSAAVPGIGVRYELGVDGASLALLLLTSVVLVVCAIWALHEPRRPRQQAALYLFLQSTCAGLFASQDLILFFLFFDLSIVAMAFSIAGWGSGARRRSALVFFLYTFAGSIALLVGFIGVLLGARTPSFEIPALAVPGALVLAPAAAVAVVAAIALGLAVKTPAVPFHSWLPPAHTDAPTIGSVVLAALLLRAVQRICTGPRTRDAEGFVDLRPHETLAIGVLLGLSLLIGVVPGPLIALVEPAATHLAALLAP